jgi:aminopeptidase N
VIRSSRAAWVAALVLAVGCAGSAPEVAPAPEASAVAEVVPAVEVAPVLPASLLPELDPEHPVDDRIAPAPAAVVHRRKPWPFDIKHYDIRVKPDFDSQSIRARVTITLRALKPGLTEVVLDAVDLDIEGVQGSEAQPLEFEVSGGKLLVRTRTPWATDADESLNIVYEAAPLRGVYFNVPTEADPEAPRQVYTQGECEDTRHWLPCHDAPDDRATHSISVRVPRGMKVVGAGERIRAGEPVVTGAGSYPTALWQFRMDVPHVSYLTTFVAGDYVEQLVPGLVPLEYVVEKRDAEYALHNFRETDAILRFFSDYTGRTYPYARYAQTCVREFRFGGMENISATTLTDRTIHPPDWEPEKSSTGLVSHEAAHQWFGDLITCRSWDHIWLNEGFATYFNLLYTEHSKGRDAFLLGLRGSRNSGLGAYDGEKRPVVTAKWADPFDLFDGHAYGGGAARLHMLRSLLGDDVFQQVVRGWVKRFQEHVVVTDDFRGVVNQITGKDYGWWFEQWLEGPGYPKLKVRWEWDGGAMALKLKVEQTQKVRGGVPPAFKLPLDVAFDMPDGTVVTKRLSIARRKQTFTIPFDVEPTFVRPDPETTLLARFDLDLSPAERVRALYDPNPVRRIEAAEAVGKLLADGKRDFEERLGLASELVLALVLERVPPVRKVLVGQSARFRDPAEKGTPLTTAEAHRFAMRRPTTARGLIASLVRADTDLRVRLAAIRALGGYVEDAPVAAVLRVELTNDHDLVRAAAVRSFAKAKADGAYEALEAALARPGWQSVARAAALEAFADLGDARCYGLLVEHASAAHDPSTRSAAIKALGRMAKKHPAFRDPLLEHLTDPSVRIRRAVANALKDLADPNTIPALVTAYGSEHWKPTRKAMRKAIHGCRKQALKSKRLVTTEVVRAAGLRERHAALGKELEGLAAGASARRGEIRTERTGIAKDLRAIGVGLK